MSVLDNGEEGHVVHCWEEGPRRWDDKDDDPEYGIGSSCWLPSEHEGPHEFTWDDEIQVTVANGG